MDDFRINRRNALLGLAALPFATAARAQAAKYTFRSIEVDVAPVRALGDSFTPPVVASELQAALAKTFAPYLGKSGYTLRARVDHVTYGQTPSHPTWFAGDSKDFIDGAGLVVGPGGKVIASYPLMTFVDVSFSHDGGSEDDIRRRATELADVFARWLPGQMGL